MPSQAFLNRHAGRLATSSGIRQSRKMVDGKFVLVNTGDPRPFPFLDAIRMTFNNDVEWEIISYELSGMDTNDITDATTDVTLAWVNKGLTTLRIVKDGVVMPWSGFLGPFAYKPGEKLGKRLAALSWQSDLHLRAHVKYVAYGDFAEPDPKVVSVMIITEPVPGMADLDLADGGSIVRPSFRNRLVERVKDVNKRVHYFKEVNYNKRFILPGGIDLDDLADGALGKGNNIVAASDYSIPADVVIFLPNAKPELFSTASDPTMPKESSGIGYFVMYPEHQNWFNQVFLDRQSRTHFFGEKGCLYDMAMLKGWFKDWMVAHIEEMREGKIPSWMLAYRNPDKDKDEGTIASFRERFVKFNAAGLSTLDSLSMYNSVAKATELVLDPPSKKPDAKKLPVKYAVRVMLRSYSLVRFGGYMIAEMQTEQVFVHERLGLIVPDCDYKKVAGILGGGDQDDHIVVPIRRDSVSEKYVTVLFRNPIGGGRNRKGRWASEYWVAEVVNAKRLIRKAKNHSLEEVPWIDLFRLPDRIDINMSKTHAFNPQGLPRSKVAYDVSLVRELALGAQLAMIAYGIHCNLQMFGIRYNIPLTYFGPEELFADTCQQKPAMADVMQIMDYNAIHAREILVHLARQGIKPDRYDWERIANFCAQVAEKDETLVLPTDAYDYDERDKAFEPGPTTEIVNYHRKMMRYFRSQVFNMGSYIQSRTKKNFPLDGYVSYEVGTKNRPWLMGLSSFLKDVNEPKTGADWDEIGNDMVLAMEASGHDPFQLIRETVGYCAAYGIAQPDRATDINRYFKHTDRDLINGAMLDYYISFLLLARRGEQ